MSVLASPRGASSCSSLAEVPGDPFYVSVIMWLPHAGHAGRLCPAEPLSVSHPVWASVPAASPSVTHSCSACLIEPWLNAPFVWKSEKKEKKRSFRAGFLLSFPFNWTTKPSRNALVFINAFHLPRLKGLLKLQMLHIDFYYCMSFILPVICIKT